MKKEEKRVSLVDSYLTHHVKTEEERQEILEEIRRNTNQLQNEFQTLQQPEYSSSVAIEKARQNNMYKAIVRNCHSVLIM